MSLIYGIDGVICRTMAPQAAHWLTDMTELQVNRISSALRNACRLEVVCCSTKDRFRLRCAYFVTSEKTLETDYTPATCTTFCVALWLVAVGQAPTAK